jgi:1-phosphofructokinase family hexose kinase
MIYTVTLNPTIDRTLHYARLIVGELNRATSSRMDLSGKGVNVSMGLRVFGLASVLLGIGAGASGRILVEGLRAQGYICDFTEVAGETRSNITVIDDATGVTTKLNEPGPTVSEADLAAFEEGLLERVQPGDRVVFSGSLPPGAPASTYARFIKALHGRGAQGVLDTSGQALVLGCAAQPALLKPNADEAAELVGGAWDTPAGLVRGIKSILALGPRRVLLSLGELGAVYADGTSIWLGVPPKIAEVNAVGAGDALMAAGLWAWINGQSAEEITHWAVACGTAAAMQDGTFMPTLAKVREVYREVRVEDLNGTR